VQAQHGEAPVEREQGRLGAKPLATPLAQVDPELGGAVAMVDTSQLPPRPATRSRSASSVKGMTLPLPLATSRSFSQRW
jgi:hypothetical protein